jgi:hypothetical protein
MIDESSAVLPLWMLISATFGFMIGEALGGQARLRKYIEKTNEELREQLQEAKPSKSNLSHELDRQGQVLNEIHRYLIPVSEGSKKTTA